MMGALVIAWRIGAAVLLLPLAWGAALAGELAGCVLTLAVLAICCGRTERD